MAAGKAATDSASAADPDQSEQWTLPGKDKYPGAAWLRESWSGQGSALLTGDRVPPGFQQPQTTERKADLIIAIRS
eukprot:2554784-Lingulodinium_polyedra.AAC.1